MIISASRRTDIPSYYTDWFLNCIQERRVYVQNPINVHQVREIDLSPDAVDGIVFWTKNPKPLLDKLHCLKNYAYYFQFTLTPYNHDIETGLPDKNEILETFKKLSDMIGPQKVIWRYDPVLFNHIYTLEYHINAFNDMAFKLQGYTEKIIFSFIDFYKKIHTKLQDAGIYESGDGEKNTIAENFSRAAHENRLALATCAETIDLSKYGIGHAACIDPALIAKITGREFAAKKDRNQRPACGCAASVDIGRYNSCPAGCIYCYANAGPAPKRGAGSDSLSHFP